MNNRKTNWGNITMVGKVIPGKEDSMVRDKMRRDSMRYVNTCILV
jgi:hypothetical protein